MFMIQLPKGFKVGDTVSCRINPTWNCLTPVTWIDETTLDINGDPRVILEQGDAEECRIFRCEDKDGDAGYYGGRNGSVDGASIVDVLAKLRARTVSLKANAHNTQPVTNSTRETRGRFTLRATDGIVHKLILTGDVELIQKVQETHFKVKEPECTDDFRDIVLFDSINNEHEYDAPRYGFQLKSGLTDPGSSINYPTWEGDFASPFYIEFLTKWIPAFRMVEALAMMYPDLSIEYRYWEMLEGGREGWATFANGAVIDQEHTTWHSVEDAHE
jgi:Ferredoxin-like domain in Api92-like protein